MFIYHGLGLHFQRVKCVCIVLVDNDHSRAALTARVLLLI